jgi:hypothetical protein
MLLYWEKRAKQETCAWCKYERRRNKVIKKQKLIYLIVFAFFKKINIILRVSLFKSLIAN